MDFFSNVLKAAEEQRKFMNTLLEMWVDQVEKLLKVK